MVLKLCAQIVIFVAVGVVIALRVQSNGWGSLIWYFQLVAFFIIRIPYLEQYQTNVITDKWNSNRDKVVNYTVFFVSTLLPVLYLVFGPFSIANYIQPLWAVSLGTSFGIPGIWLVWRSHSDLGQNWSYNVELRDEHSLITNGVYSTVRHPMYTAFFCMSVSQTLLIPNWIIGPLGLIGFLVFYSVRVEAEESLLHQHFGETYAAYCERTDRLIPFKALYSSM